MIIEYSTKKWRKICTEPTVANKEYGPKMAAKISQRIDELSAASSVEEMLQYHIGNYHGLTGDRSGQYAVNLVQPYRLVFTKKDNEIQIVNIIEIVDYH